MTVTKAERRESWLDGIISAIDFADKELLKNPDDGGTCNFDACMVKKEKFFTYAEIIRMFADCGLYAAKMTGIHRGYIYVGGKGGQADSRTRWAEAFKKELEENGFICSMYYQCD